MQHFTICVKVKPPRWHISAFIIFNSESQLQLAPEKTRKWARRPVALIWLHTQQKQKHHYTHLNQGVLCVCGVCLLLRGRFKMKTSSAGVMTLPQLWNIKKESRRSRRDCLIHHPVVKSRRRRRQSLFALASLYHPAPAAERKHHIVLCWSRGCNPWMGLTRGQKQNNLSQHEVVICIPSLKKTYVS